MSTVSSKTSLLTRAGWEHITDPAHRQECGMPGPNSGYCMRNARWREHRGARPMCAHHAAEVATRRGAR